MSGALADSVSDITRQLLIDLKLGVDLGTQPQGAWPVFSTTEPDNPDNVITTQRTQAVLNAREMQSGEWIEHHGFQVRVRATDQATGDPKARAIGIALDKVYNSVVHVGANTYGIHSVSRRGDVIDLGMEPNSNRHLYTINFLIRILQTS